MDLQGYAAQLLARFANTAIRHRTWQIAMDGSQKLPQRLLNVTVSDRNALEGADEVWEAVEMASTRLEGRGRVLVRSSGTEPLIRIMVEAPEEAECEEIVQSLAKTVESCLR